MNEQLPTPLRVRFEALARPETDRIKDWSIDSDFLVSTDGFSFTLYDDDPRQLIGLELQPIELTVGGHSQGFGRIDATDIGDDGGAVTCEGRDYLSDLVECNTDPALILKEGMTLGDFITLAASPVGIDAVISSDDVAMQDVRAGVKVRKKKGGTAQLKQLKLDDYKPKPGQGIYEFLNNVVSRHRCTMQPGPDRQTILIVAPDYDQEPIGKLIRTRDQATGTANNIVSGRARRDFSSFPTYTIVQGIAARNGEKGDNATQSFGTPEGVKELTDILQAIAIDVRRKPGEGAALGLALYRLLVFRDDEARNADQILAAAKRALAERLKDTLVYTATLRGHQDPDTGAIYSVNTMIHVDDEITNVHEPLWIKQRTLSYSRQNGAQTRIVAWRPGSFVL